MEKIMQFLKLASLVASLLVLPSCGGGGGGGESSTPAASTLSGVAAVGTPIVNGNINVVCAAGSALVTTTNTTGAWSVTLSGQTLPCAVEVSGGTINGVSNTTPYHSIATTTGTVNVTPLTDLMVANLAGTATPSIWFAGLRTTSAPLAAITQTQVNAALTKLSAALSGLTPLSSTNPITTTFTPTAGNVSDDMLTALKTALATNTAGVTYASLLSNASTTTFTAPVAGFGTAMTTAYAGTTSGGTVGTIVIGGAVTGLTGSVVLQDNGGDNKTVSANGSFTFATNLANGRSYNVTVLTQPAGQTCSVSTGAGTVSVSNVTNVAVVCSTNTFNVGGSVSGLAGSMVLQDNNGDNLTVAASGAFTFATKVANGSAYSVTVLSHPAGQSCSVASGTGTIALANVNNVTVTCATNTYTIGGTVTGLNGSMVLQDNGGDNKTVSTNGSFTFPTTVASGSAYNATVLTQPSGQTCAVTGGSGTATANVTSVVVNCTNTTTLPVGYVSQGSLTWMPNGLNIAAGSSSPAYTYAQATALCAGTINNQTGWRLPTQVELSALSTSGALIPQGSLNAQLTWPWVRSYTWSSTPGSVSIFGNTYNIVDLGSGNVTLLPDSYSILVTCVR